MFKYPSEYTMAVLCFLFLLSLVTIIICALIGQYRMKRSIEVKHTIASVLGLISCGTLVFAFIEIVLFFIMSDDFSARTTIGAGICIFALSYKLSESIAKRLNVGTFMTLVLTVLITLGFFITPYVSLKMDEEVRHTAYCTEYYK